MTCEAFIGDELAVGEAVHPDRGIDPLDPESAHQPLLHAPVAVRILHPAQDVLLGDLVELAAPTEPAAGRF
jgi:hypothetical protein